MDYRSNNRRTTARYAVLLISILLVPSASQGTNHFVRAGATGNGSDWTNAFTALPASLVRGDIYYIAAGTYGPHDFNDPESGSATIEIRAVTAADHGTDTGWSSSFIGQAVFTATSTTGYILRFSKAYYILNGQYRGADWKSGYGIRVSNFPGKFASGADIQVGWGLGPSHDVTIKYVEIEGSHYDGISAVNQCPPTKLSTQYDIGLVAGTAASNIALQYTYIHDNHIHAKFNGKSGPGAQGTGDNNSITYSYLTTNFGDCQNHTEGLAAAQGITNWTIAYNRIFNQQGGVIADPSGANNVGNGPWRIYGNVIGLTSDATNCNAGQGVFDLFAGTNFSDNVYIYNNAMSNLSQAGCGYAASTPFISGTASSPTSMQTVYFVNNLIWNSPRAVFPTWVGSGTFVMDYNVYFDTDGSADPGGHSYTVKTGSPFSNSPFVDWSNGNFHLAIPAQDGLHLSAPFNTDPDGAMRGAGAQNIWSRGAFQYVPPNPPTNLKATPH